MIGMHILHANGSVGVVTGWKIVLGVTMMYNLEAAQDHTFTVGDGQWVVHNCPNPDETPPSFRTKGLPTDAYRSGSPDLDLTLGKPDVDSRTGNVKMGLSNGLSHFDRIVSYFEGKTVYELSAGTEAPDGLTWSYKWNSTVGAYHIGLQSEPGTTMSQDVYESIAEILRASYKEKS